MTAEETGKKIIETSVNVKTHAMSKFKSGPLSRNIDWTINLENILFKAMSRKRPVWAIAHFSMASILKIFNANSGLNLSADDIWEKLNTLYKMDAINQKQVKDLPKSFRERKDFDLTTHPQLKKKIEPLSPTDLKEQVKTDVPVVVESVPPTKPTKKAVVRRPRKPKVPVSVPPAVINKPRKVTLEHDCIAIPVKSRKSRKTEVKPKPVPILSSKATAVQKKPNRIRKTIFKIIPIPVPAKSIPAKSISDKSIPAKSLPAKPIPAKPIIAKPIPAKPIPAKPIPAKPIPAKPILAKPILVSSIPDSTTTTRKRGRPIKKPTLPEALSPPPRPAKKRRVKVTITK